jgi:hypothetical protein
VEFLEDRTALSSTSLVSPAFGEDLFAAAMIKNALPPYTMNQALFGQVHGTWKMSGHISTEGTMVMVGGGVVQPLGGTIPATVKVHVTAMIHFAPNVPMSGTVTLSDHQGTLTVNLVAAHPGRTGWHVATYTIVGGTGEYAGLSGSGSALMHVTETGQRVGNFTFRFGP